MLVVVAFTAASAAAAATARAAEEEGRHHRRQETTFLQMNNRRRVRVDDIMPNVKELLKLEKYKETHNFLWDKQLQDDHEQSDWFQVAPLDKDVNFLRLKREVWYGPMDKRAPRFFRQPLLGMSVDSHVQTLMDQLIDKTNTLYDDRSKDDRNALLRQIYRELYQHDDWEKKHVRRIATFHNVHVNQYGTIVKLNDDYRIDNQSRITRNGGCTSTPHRRLYEFTRFRSVVRSFANGSSQPILNLGPDSIQRFDASQPVIALGSGASGTYHFVLELLVGLAGIDDEALQRSYVLIPHKTLSAREWLSLANVADDRIVAYGHVFAQTLFAPELGACGKCYHEQLIWLANAVDVFLSKNPALMAMNFYGNFTMADTRPIITYVKRKRNQRGIANFDAAINVVKAFAQKEGFRLIVHGDQGVFPSIKDQLALFSRTSIMVSTHGAGQLFISVLPSNACVLDFSALEDPYTIYSRIAYLRRVSYLLFVDKLPGQREIKVADLQYGLSVCKKAVTEGQQG